MILMIPKSRMIITKFAKTSKMKAKLLVASVLVSALGYAQEGPYISDAIISIDKNNDLTEAYGFIEEAEKIINGKSLSEVKKKNLQKYYYYQGLINLRIAQSQDEAVKSLNANAVEDATNNFVESIAFEKQIGKKKFSDQSTYYLQECANMMFTKGAELSDGGDKAGAADVFFAVYELKSTKMDPPIVDTTAYYNAVVLSEQAGETDPAYVQKAIEGNEKLIEMGYSGVSWLLLDLETQQRVPAGSKANAERVVEQQPQKYGDPQPTEPTTPEIYKALIRLYKKAGDDANYKATLKKGRELYPSDDFFVKYELQDFLDAGDYDSAMKNLDLAIASDPGNGLFYYVKGFIQSSEMNDNEGAMVSFDKALEIDPTNGDAMYMKGFIYVDQANKITEEMNKLPLNATKKYNALKTEQKGVFEQALPLFEKAHELKPDDADVIRALKEVYYKLDMPEKSMEMNKKLESMPQG